MGKKFRDSFNVEVALQGKSTVRAREIGSCTLIILMREVENNPSLIAQQVKERNPGLLHDTSIRIIQHRFREDLNYRRYVAKIVPHLTARQIKARLKYAKNKVKRRMKK